MAAAKRRDLALTKTSAKELKDEAQVTPASVERARDEWREVAPARLRNIPDAIEK